MNTHAENVPEAMRNEETWICWREEERNGNKTKVPINPGNGDYASATDPDTWTSFDEAVNTHQQDDIETSGIGFVFSSNNMIAGVDLDKCRDPETGEIDDWAMNVLEKLDSYTEVSPSGTGLHVIIYGVVPGDKNRRDNLEVYDNKRFFTVTGDRLPVTEKTVKPRGEELKQVYSERIESTESTADNTSKPDATLDDEEIIEKATSSNSDFAALWNGSAAGYESQSEADMALLLHLVFWTGGDAAQMERLFTQSEFGSRDKWRNRKDYRERSIKNAIKHHTGDYYEPGTDLGDIEFDFDTPPNAVTTDNENSSERVAAKAAAATPEWEFKNILPPDHFITRHIEMASNRTDAYPEYHFVTALSMLSLAVDRNAIIRITPQEMYPNLWSLCIGYSTVSRKSTALKIGRNVLENAGLGNKILADDFSPEALIAHLDENPQSMFFKDEFGDFLAKMDRSYQAGIGALLSRLYDCPDRYVRQLRKEKFDVRDVYLTMLGACVPRQVGQYTNMNDLESGFFPRMNIIWPERPKERKNVGTPTQMDKLQQVYLGAWLEHLHTSMAELKEQFGHEVGFVLDEDALDFYNEWCKEFESFIHRTEKGKEFSAFFGRLSDNVLKMSALIEMGSPEFSRRISSFSVISSVSSVNSVSSTRAEILRRTEHAFNFPPIIKKGSANPLTAPKNFKISLDSVKTATYYAVKLFLPNAHKLMTYVQAYDTDSNVRKVYDLAVRHADEDGLISHSTLLRNSHLPAKDFRHIMETLVEADMVAVHENSPIKYQPLDPEGDVKIPDVAQPVDIGFEALTEDADDYITFTPGKTDYNEVVTVLESAGDPVTFEDLLEMVGFSEDELEAKLEKLEGDGRVYSPRSGEWTVL